MTMTLGPGGVEQLDDGLPALDDGQAPPLPDGDTPLTHDPAQINAIAAAALADNEDYSIKGPPDGSVKLIAGYIDPSGSRWTTAEVRELRGRDEEELARALATGDLARYLDAIVRCGTVRVGNIDDPKEVAAALDTLLVGDRDMLILQIRRLAFGDTMRLDPVVCPFCQHEFAVDYSFSDDVPLKAFEPSTGDVAQRLFDIDGPSGKRFSIRMVDGRAQKAVFTPETSKKTDAEVNTLLLREVLEAIDGRPVTTDAQARDLVARDRKFLLNWLNEGQPGPQYQDVKQTCEECARSFPLVVRVSDMFLGD